MFTVLVKVVPELDDVRVDPRHHTLVRDGAHLHVNPFDQRAVRVALELRRTGETVHLLSMGPPAARAVLRESLAQGVDRATLVTDPALAGSDSLVTARVLARAARRGPHSVVVTGAWSTDSETGQVPPMVAGILGVPVVTGARRIERDADGPGFTVTVDTPAGWRRLWLAPPFVVSVGEKITKPLRVAPEAVAAVPLERVATLSAAELALEPAQLGGSGSPTVVASVRSVAPERRPVLLDAGPVADRVAEAIRRLAPLLAREVPAPAPIPPRAGPLSDRDRVDVLVTDDDGALDPTSPSLLLAVRRDLAPLWPRALWIGPSVPPAAARALASAGAAGLVQVPVPAPFTSRTAALAVEGVLDAGLPGAALLFGSDPFGREVAGQLAARQGLGLVGDAVGVVRRPDGTLQAEKPAFGGGMLAEVTSRTRPFLATVRVGAGADGPVPDPVRLEAEPFPLSLPVDHRIERLAAGVEGDARWGDLGTARVVVAVGMGLGGPERLAALEPLRAATGAAVAATRRVVDAGWLPRTLQVGLTGRSAAPDLAVLLGVRGSENHLVGWRRARALLAVNPDPAAPVFAGVDVGIVAGWEEVVGPLADGLGPLVRRDPPA